MTVHRLVREKISRLRIIRLPHFYLPGNDQPSREILPEFPDHLFRFLIFVGKHDHHWRFIKREKPAWPLHLLVWSKPDKSFEYPCPCPFFRKHKLHDELIQ